ncbi:DNA-(apurinic or apyrimidinic site) lyase APN1 [Aspergillus lucknowensis]|uniref:Xylose isomerase-like protein n=1 Tax=Aspergillus lucknowensis TaxID=176173 RepID=A0ABR4M2G2_9EURO
MSPRSARRATSSALPVADEIQPKTNKRKTVEDRELPSPRRQSKRIKSTEQLRAEPSSSSPAVAGQQSARTELETRSLRKGTVKAQSRANDSTILIKEELEEEKEEQGGFAGVEGEAERLTASTTRTTKKRKSKKGEAEAMPLRPRTQGLRMYVGAHVSAAKGVFNAVNNSMHIGGNAFALFLKSQRKWDNPPLQEEHRDNFLRLCKEHNYDAAKYVLPHGSYLVNLAQEDKAKAKQAYDSFLDDLRRCESLGIKLYNFHPGSANQSSFPDALSRLAKALTNALSATTTVVPVLETMCGHGSTIGGSLSEFRDLLALIPKEFHPRVGICIDTCHSFAAGYDLVSPTGFKAFMKEFEDLIGIQHLRALHLNDSKAPRGSKRDLHANIGTGFLGLRAFHNVMNEPRFEGIPMILETPIDRPPTTSKDPPSTASNEADADEEDHDGEASEGEIQPKKITKKKQPKRPAAAKTQLVPDFSVWAREIELLESLIGMDPEGPRFRELEAKLSDEGRETREKHMEQFQRKLEADEKKKAKGQGKQKTLMEMMGNNSKGKRKTGQKTRDEESEDEGCQSC